MASRASLGGPAGLRSICASLIACTLAVGSAAAADGDARLADALAKDDVTAARTLLRQKADVNAPLADGTTPLLLAVKDEDAELVDTLIQAGAKVNTANRYGVTPLNLAASLGNAPIARRLIKAGADHAALDASGETILMIAIRSGNADAVRALVEVGAAIDAKDAATEQSALMWAVRANQPAVVQLLVERGAEVNARTRTGATPEFRPPNAGGGSHGLGIVRGGWPERGARDATPGAMSALLYAARDGRADIAKTLVAAGADVNQAEANGVTPLLMAILNDHQDVARLMVERGANVNADDWWGRTPLWAAVEIRNRDYTRTGEHGVDRAAALDTVALLLDRGANVNARTREVPPIRRWVTPLSDVSWVEFTGQTPFIRAALAGDITVMRLLLGKGADPAITTEGGTSALMAAAGLNWAVQQTYTESKESLLQAVQLCLDKGLDVNAANSNGQTAVMGAANRGSDDILELLVTRGARLDVADKNGRTPMRWAQGEFLATNPPEAKPSTIALIKKLTGEK